MNSSKRSSFSSSKSSKFNGKLKEILSSSARQKVGPKEILSSSARQKVEPKVAADIKDFSNVPIVRQVDNARLLPKYTSILLKNNEDGVAMDDLHQLQQDLEKLLSTNALRTRFFLGEYSQADQKDIFRTRLFFGEYSQADQKDIHHDKKAHDKTSLKRKRPDDRPKSKDLKNGIRVVKKDPLKIYNDNMFQEIPKITLPRNDNSDKFWASIEPYCAPVNKDDVVFLDGLVQEFSKEIDIKIPEIGEHYASSWSDELVNDEQNLGKSPIKKPTNADFKKNGLHMMVESFATPHTQRLLSALIQERALKAANSITKNAENGIKINKIKSSELIKIKHNIGQKVGTCLDKRLLKELVDQGILKHDDINKNVPEDEILTEIKKCQQELVTVNEYNLEELNKLRSAVMNDIHCNQLKDDLDKIDKEVLDLYNNIMVARKKALQDEGKDYDKIFSEEMVSDFERKANALLRQQHVLNREINSMTDMSMLY